MSEQAENNDIETFEDEAEVEQEVDLSQETDEDQAESEEFEIVAEEEPTSKPVPLQSHLKRVHKLNSKVEAERQGKTEAEQRLEAASEENKLLRLKLQQMQESPALKAPKPEDFDTDLEYELAKREHKEAQQQLDQERTRQLIREEAERLLASQSQVQTREVTEKQFEGELVRHYERAESLKVKDYDETEDAAIEIFGKDIAKQIMANSDNSHIALYHFGKNRAKAEEFKAKIMSNPVKGMLEIGGYMANLKVRPKSSQAPDPEMRIEGGGSGKPVSPFLRGATFT